MKLSERIKNKKKFIIGVVIGIVVVNIIGIAGAIAASVTSDVVLYDSPTGKKNVKDAIDELYTLSSNTCNIEHHCTDNDNSGDVTEGDLITYGTESFYVMGFEGDNIKLLPNYNIEVTTSNPKQTTDTGYLAFSSSAYWGTISTTNDRLYIYDARSNLYKYVEAYKTVLINLGMNVICAKLITYDEMIYLWNTRKYSWAINQKYWSGAVRGSDNCIYVTDNILTWSTGNTVATDYSFSYSTNPIGIRPVIIIPKSSI